MERKLYLINQQYHPEVVSTGQVFQAIAEHLHQRGWQVRVVTGTPFYPGMAAKAPRREVLGGVMITRLRNTAFPKKSLSGKLFNQLTFMVSLLCYALFRIPKDAVVLVTTAPPLSVMCAAIGSFFRRYKVVLTVQDLYPDVLAASGMSSTGGAGYKLLRFFMQVSMKSCTRVITISTDIQRHLKHAYGLADVLLIPNLSPGDVQVMDNASIKEARGWGDKLVVQYSGNFGVAHEYKTLLTTIRSLRGREAIHFHITGAGVHYDKLRDACVAEGLPNVTFEGYAPLSELSTHLALADCSLVIFDEAFRNVLLPSKYYGILASGRAVVLLSGSGNDIERDIAREQIGVTFGPGQAEELAETLTAWEVDRAHVRRMGRRARALYDRQYRGDEILKAYEGALERVREGGR